MSEKDLREKLNELDLDADSIEEIVSSVKTPEEVIPEPKSIVPDLEVALLYETDWKKRASLAARIISERYDKGY
uniref:Uncharacterized protein n=1 Tax=viral metagenome TaxID=1070528 RepID=A0A6M3LUY5_9ZZZZ